MKLFLEETHWFGSNHNVYACGKLFYQGTWFLDQSLADFLITITSRESLHALLEKAEGFFSFILLMEEELYIVSDLTRSVPLFWRIDNADEVFISDDPYSLCREDTMIDDVAQKEMILAGYVIGKRTIYSDVFQTEAGKYIVFSHPHADGLADEVKYIDFPGKRLQPQSEDFYLKELDSAYRESIEHMIGLLKGRQILIPLSGGLDSRFLLALLWDAGYRNILTFTYGRKETQEVSVSKAIADYFGAKWVYVPYLNSELQKLFQKQFRKICLSTSLGISTPCLQDWYALEYMKSNHLIQADAVVVPGHAISSVPEFLDAELIQKGEYTQQDIINQTVRNHFCLMHAAWAEDKPAIEKELNQYYQFKCAVYNNMETYAYLADFAYRERQSKYIINSVRMYESEQLDWYLPFWTPNLVRLWGEMPLNLCIHRQIYYRLIEKRYPELQEKVKFFGHTAERGTHAFHAPSVRSLGVVTLLRPALRRFRAIRKRYTDNTNLFGYLSPVQFYQFILAGNCSPVSMWNDMTRQMLKQQLKNTPSIRNSFAKSQAEKLL